MVKVDYCKLVAGVILKPDMLILHGVVLVDAEGEDRRLLHEQGVELAGVSGVVFGGEAETSESLVVFHAD